MYKIRQIETPLYTIFIDGVRIVERINEYTLRAFMADNKKLSFTPRTIRFKCVTNHEGPKESIFRDGQLTGPIAGFSIIPDEMLNLLMKR